jgi:hypothetical protein
MIKRRPVLITLILALGLGLSYSAARSAEAAGMAPEAKPEGVRSATVLTVHGKIVEVNKAKKLVTVEGPAGRKVTLRVNNPYNLAAAKVGEPVVARFYEVVTIRKKKPGESVPSASLKEGIATARPGEVPGAVVARQLSVTVSVAAIDRANGTVTVKAPDGTIEKVKARNPKNLEHLKVGEELVVTLSRAIAISLEKAPKG